MVIRTYFSNDNINPWQLSLFIDRFSNNLAKIWTLDIIATTLSKGLSPEQIYLYPNSKNIWNYDKRLLTSNNLYQDHLKNGIPLVSTQGKINAEFDKKFRNIRRPVLLLKVNGGFQILNDFYSGEEIRLIYLEFNSPGIIDININLDGLLSEIRFGHEREKREKQKHEMEMLDYLSRIYQRVQDSDKFKEFVGRYIKSELDFNMFKIENMKNDFSINKIDIKI